MNPYVFFIILQHISMHYKTMERLVICVEGGYVCVYAIYIAVSIQGGSQNWDGFLSFAKWKYQKMIGLKIEYHS